MQDFFLSVDFIKGGVSQSKTYDNALLYLVATFTEQLLVTVNTLLFNPSVADSVGFSRVKTQVAIHVNKCADIGLISVQADIQGGTIGIVTEVKVSYLTIPT